MRPALLAALGLALAGLGRLYLLLFLGLSLDPFLLCLLALSAGLFLAAGGAASLAQPRGRALLALGLGLASAGTVGRALLDLGSLDFPGSLLMALGALQAAWAAALWAAEDGARSEARLGSMRLSFAVMSAAAVWYVFTATTRSNPLVMPAPLLLLAGLVLATWAVGDIGGTGRPRAARPADTFS